jgi:hypothetical protein
MPVMIDSKCTTEDVRDGGDSLLTPAEPESTAALLRCDMACYGKMIQAFYYPPPL